MEKAYLENLLINENLSMNKIAAREGKSLASVRHWCKKYGLSSTHKNFSQRDEPHKCKECGETNPTMFEQGRKSLCLNCRRKWYSQHAKDVYLNTEPNSRTYKKARIDKKKALVDYKGGECVICGYAKTVKALDFHHVDPNTKEFSVSNSMFKSLEDLKIEVDKCVILCKNCHTEFHDGLVEIPAVRE